MGFELLKIHKGKKILNTGTGSNKQRKIYASSKNFEHMLKTLKEQFYH